VPIQSTIHEPQGNSGFNLASASASLPHNMLFERFDGRKLDEIEIVTEKIAKDDTCWETEECEYCKDDDDSPGEERRVLKTFNLRVFQTSWHLLLWHPLLHQPILFR
jgi:hypothetical protein